MKKVLFFAMFALLAICMMVGCNGETKVVDSAATFDVLTNAVYSISPFAYSSFAPDKLNKEIQMTSLSDGAYETFVGHKQCRKDGYELLSVDGSFILTTNSDLTSTNTDITLKVTEDIGVVISATDFDGNKTLTLTINEGAEIKSKAVKYENEDEEITISISNATINDVKSEVKYTIKYSSENGLLKGSVIVNGSEVKSSLLTQSFMYDMVSVHIEIDNPS